MTCFSIISIINQQSITDTHNIEVIFDTNHSGASLAWSYFHKKVPFLIEIIEDRDCHFNKIENANVALMWLDTHPFVFQLWSAFANFDKTIWDKVIEYNKPMIKKFNSMIKKAAKQSVEFKLSGYNASFCFGTEETASDIAIEMSNKNKGIGVVFVLQKNGSIKASLRTKENIDLVPIAKKLGGNGHSFAAAFKCNPELLTRILNKEDVLI